MAEHQPYRLAGVMGWPVAHSRSPVIHNHWIEQYGLRGAYVLLPVQPEKLEVALRSLPVLGFSGCNLTIPHKVAALEIVDRVDPLARRIWAVNTVVVEADGTLTGLNTDGFGYIQSLLDVQPEWTADAGPVVVLGAGGASRAIIVALLEHGAQEIRLTNRSPDKASTWPKNLATECLPCRGRKEKMHLLERRLWSTRPTKVCTENLPWIWTYVNYHSLRWYLTLSTYPRKHYS